MENRNDEELEIDLRSIFLAMKQRVLVIIASALLLGCVSCLFTMLFITPKYSSSATMLVLPREDNTTAVSELQAGTQLTNDYAVLLTSRPVLESVINELSLDMTYQQLNGTITVENPQDTRLLQITVENPDPEAARDIVNQLAATASAYIGDNMEVEAPKVIEQGEIPTERTSPNMKKMALLGLAAGLILSMGIIALKTILDDTVKTEDDITRYLNISTLASVPDRKDFISNKGKKTRGKKKNSKKRKSR